MARRRKKDELMIKTKKRILRETSSQRSLKEYTTTYKDIKRYFRVFNKTLFKNKLNPFNDIKIKNLKGAYGQCVENISHRKGTNFYVLEMMPTYKNKRDFISTLAHEMIHLWQQTVKKNNGNHNDLFYSFRPKFKKLNLEL